jgi:spermidine/putrescine transport system permease protein
MKDLLHRYGKGLTALTFFLTAFWLVLLVFLPYFDLFESSFRPYLPAVDVGGPLDVYSANNYTSIFHSPIEVNLGLFGLSTTFSVPIHLWVFTLTIVYSAATTLLSLLLCYPLAYYLAKVISPSRLASFMLILIVPMWVSELLRSFAWFILLAFKGPLTVVLMNAGIISEPIHWTWGLGGYSGVVVTLIYVYILFMLFPIYNAMTSLDNNQIEAAEDLGAKSWQTHLRVIVPHCKPGIASGCVTVFMLAVAIAIITVVH